MQDAGDGGEELVADVVAVGVVDGFEPVEVDEDEGEALPLENPSGVAGGQAGAVGDPGERVVQQGVMGGVQLSAAAPVEGEGDQDSDRERGDDGHQGEGG